MMSKGFGPTISTGVARIGPFEAAAWRRGAEQKCSIDEEALARLGIHGPNSKMAGLDMVKMYDKQKVNAGNRSPS